MKVETLVVPGATLHYEVRGSGPVLLLICGGVYDAEGFDGLAEALAEFPGGHGGHGNPAAFAPRLREVLSA